jgi:ABC-type antimicrobial peptide transport system permease subunit
MLARLADDILDALLEGRERQVGSRLLLVVMAELNEKVIPGLQGAENLVQSVCAD